MENQPTKQDQQQLLTQIKTGILKPDLTAYSEVQLTEEEIALALMEKRREKAAKLNHEVYMAKLRAPKTYPKFTSAQLFEHFKQNSGLIVDEFNKQIITDLCDYFSETPSDRFSLNKGILLFGGVGVGKTSIMNYFRKNQWNSYIVNSCRQVSYDYTKYGSDSIEKYNAGIKADPELNFGQSSIGVCFDDLGTEEDKKHFGNQSNVMADIILNRYDKLKVRTPNGTAPYLQSKTHITTNLNRQEIKDKYGSRVESRLDEMFNFFIFEKTSPDRRKTQNF